MPEQQRVDLAPINTKLAEMDKAIHAIKMPELQRVDLAPINTKLAEMDKAIHAIKMPEQTKLDLQPIYVRFAEIERHIGAIRIPAPSVLDLSPVLSRFGSIEDKMKTLSKMEEVDFASLFVRLDQIEQAFNLNIKHLSKQVADTDKHLEKAFVAVVADYSKHIRPDGGKNLLTGPVYGKPDDLKRIVGVAGVLEKMMHNIGVYYFWQVAEWTAEDIVFVDSKLTAFRGRIKRDHWVKQCRKFAQEPTSARPTNGAHSNLSH
jgi:predicted flap endonuclease-1-like 5' DNA nuclease